jgi:ATP-dependent Lhr-like helicase
MGLFSDKLEKAIKSRFKDYTNIQREAFEPILEGSNVVICSETGSGKTEAAMLPLIEKILSNQTKGIKVLYVTPLRALNRDIYDRLSKVANEVGVEIAVRHGDTPKGVRDRLRAEPPDILVTTPETFQALITDPKNLQSLKTVNCIVIDESNELIRSKRGSQLSLGITRIKKYLGREIQLICLSATIKSGKFVKNFFVGKGKVIYINSFKNYYIKVDEIQDSNNLDQVYERIIQHIDSKTIIFVNTRYMAEALARITEKDERHRFSLEIHHSSLSLDKRLKVEEGLKTDQLKAVVSTSSLELGIDIGKLERVIQIGSPRSVETLAQRLGRAGHRTNAVSNGVLIALNTFDLLEILACSLLLISKWMERPKFFETPLDVLANQIVAHLLVVRNAIKKDVLELIRSSYPYKRLTEAQLDEVLRFLERYKYIRLVGDKLSAGYRAKLFFYKNISTIVSNMQFMVKDLASRSPIGFLDNSFVERYCEKGKNIILGKNKWEVVSVDFGKRTIIVKAGGQGVATIPNWSGDTLPVDDYVAKKMVDLIKSKRRLRLTIKMHLSDAVKRDLMLLPVVPELQHISAYIIERDSVLGLMVILAPIGTRGNKTLAVLIEELLIREGFACVTYSTSFGILIQSQGTTAELVKRLLISLDESSVNELLKQGVLRFGKFTDRLFNVGRRFGIEVDELIEKFGARRTHHLLESTIVALETQSEVFQDVFDVHEVLKLLRVKRIYTQDEAGKDVVALAELFLKSVSYTSKAAGLDESSLVEIVKQRVSRKSYYCFCLSCFKFQTKLTVSEIRDGFKCPHCNSLFLGFLSWKDNNSDKAVRLLRNNAKTEDKEINRIIKELVESANLYIDFGRRALIVLSGFGIGPTTVKRILRKRLVDERQLYIEILKAEQEFIRTREFWS